MKQFAPPGRFGSINLDTGEILQGVYALVPKRRKNGFAEGWFSMSNTAMARLLTMTMQRELTLRDLQVLYAMLEVLETDNYIRVSQKHLSQRLLMAQPHISRSITTLIKHGVILAGPKIGSSSTYRLSPKFGWKGSAENHHRALHNEMQKPMLAKVIPIQERDPNTIDMFTGTPDAKVNP